MTDQQTAITRLIDENAIRATTAHFADAAIRGDYDAFGAVWADDCRWVIGEPPRVDVSGRDAIISTLRRLREGREFFVQFAIQGPIEIDGDTATASCVCHESARGPGESYYRNHCMAFDRLVRRQGAWRFTSRSFLYLWLDTSAFSGESVPLF